MTEAQVTTPSAATVHEAAGQRGALPSAIQAIAPWCRVGGTAFTVRTPPHDNLWIHRAIYAAQPGDVLVVDTGQAFEAGYWGELMTHAARAVSLGGLVIDGRVRDREVLERLGFPIFSRGVCLRGTTKAQDGPGALNVPIHIGDVTVGPGDFVVGDRDGVTVVPAAEQAEVLQRSAEREAYETSIINRLREGQRLLDLVTCIQDTTTEPNFPCPYVD